jgi:outer membrane protein assembly factor BamE (lipoprotein component of BamABCDE complex)|tara:strand:- start:490 stop:975 length:486 start_codon:yes stop_codon:yes gene_type:complete
LLDGFFGFIKHMRKSIYLLLIILFFITGCKQNKVIKTHGIAYLDKREKLIFVNQSNKNDIIKALGQPSTKGMTNDNLWIYIERTTQRGKLLKLGKDNLVKNNVLVLEFDKYGILNKKNFYDMNSMKKIKFAKNKTENDINKENFVYGFLSSIRQKMQQRRK